MHYVDELLAQVDLVRESPVADRIRPAIVRALRAELADLRDQAGGDLDAFGDLVERRARESRELRWTLQSAVDATPMVDEDGFQLAILRLHHAYESCGDDREICDAASLLRRQLPWTDAWRLACDRARDALACHPVVQDSTYLEETPPCAIYSPK